MTLFHSLCAYPPPTQDLSSQRLSALSYSILVQNNPSLHSTSSALSLVYPPQSLLSPSLFGTLALFQLTYQLLVFHLACQLLLLSLRTSLGHPCLPLNSRTPESLSRILSSVESSLVSELQRSLHLAAPLSSLTPPPSIFASLSTRHHLIPPQFVSTTLLTLSVPPLIFGSLSHYRLFLVFAHLSHSFSFPTIALFYL